MKGRRGKDKLQMLNQSENWLIKSFLHLVIIHDPNNNINKPGNWLTSNMCFLPPSYTDILLYMIYILTI
jgi:hypothetical protein